MIRRAITPTLLRLSQGFPVVVLTGPRQSGKTTLVRATFPDKPYYRRGYVQRLKKVANSFRITSGTVTSVRRRRDISSKWCSGDRMARDA